MNPACPVCQREMQLKQVFRQQPSDHHIFKCEFCELEYPVVVQALVGLVTDESNG
jgi:uncharacterized protein YbaR (Trm112 family)